MAFYTIWVALLFGLKMQSCLSENYKRILLGDTDDVETRIHQLEQQMDAKMQKIQEDARSQILNLTQLINSLQQQVKDTENHVAFYATLSSHTTLGQRQTVKFDQVITNVGNGYSGVTGVFTVPIAGLYEFSTTMLSGDNGHEVHTQIMKNNIAIGQNYGDSSRSTGTMNVVISAHKGEIIYVRHHDGYGLGTQVIHGDGYSSFSGFLIHKM